MSSMSTLMVAFIAAFAISLVLTFLVRQYARHRQLVDIPDNGRHLHEQPVPRLGGVAVFGSFVPVVLAAAPFAVELPGYEPRLWAVLVGATAMMAVGLWDDISHLRARTKLILQVFVAGYVVSKGLRIESVGLLDGTLLVFPFYVSTAISVFWIVAITN